MNGIRVSNIPIQLSERLLRKYFTDQSHGGGEIKAIYYPLINNDAVIIFQNEITAVNAVVKKSEENAGSFRVAPLPHQVFSSVDVHLEPGLSTFVLATDEYIKTLREWGLQVGTGCKGPDICTLSGSWYKVEWAWNYLSQIMEKQHAIHHRVQSQISQEDSESSEFSDREYSPEQARQTNGVTRSTEIRPKSSSVKRNQRQLNQEQYVGAHRGRQNQRMSSDQNQNNSILQDRDTEFPVGLSMTSSVGDSLDVHASSRNRRARDADSTFNHFTSLQNTSNSPRQVRKEPGSSINNRESSRSSDHGQETYRIDSPDYESPERQDRPVVDDDYPDYGNEADESDSGTIHDRQSIASGHSDTPRNSLRTEHQASVESHDDLPSTSGDRERMDLSLPRARFGASSSFQAEEEVPDGYKSQVLKIGNLKIKIYLAEIINSTAEAIVNGADGELKNFAGSARAISKAAGDAMEKECEKYIMLHKRLETTHVMHTTGGKLKQFKYILHTIGPIYIGSKYKDECSFQLTQTFYNCLTYAEEKLYLKSIALPFISTGVYATPLEDCIAAFIDAVLIFIHKYHRSCTLAEIHLVNNDINIVSMASTLLQSIVDGADFDQMMDEAVSRFEMKSSTCDNVFTRSFTATGASGARPKDGGSLRRCTSMDYVNQDVPGPSRSSVIRSYDVPDRKDVIGAAGTSSTRPFRAGSFSSGKKFSQPQAPKLSNSQDLTAHSTSRYADQRSSRQSSISAKTYSVHDTDATAASISNSLKKNISHSNTKSTRNSASPMKALPRDYNADSKRTKGATGGLSKSVADRLSQSNSIDSFTSLPADLDHDRNRRTREDSFERCGICLDDIDTPKVLEKCGHKFCQDCIKHAFASKPVCPECGTVYGVIIGDQPRGGKMIHKIICSHKLDGYSDADGVLEITYTFPDGIQAEMHPTPGRAYRGLKRKAYLPNNKAGQEILQLLYKAFDARLIFTIGDSRTTGESGVLTWNDIHHKTSMTGGVSNHGYPDVTYLKRVREELQMKGIKK